MGGGRYGTIKWGDSVDSGLYESGTSMLSLGLDEIIQRGTEKRLVVVRGEGLGVWK